MTNNQERFVVFAVDHGVVDDAPLKLLTANEATQEALRILRARRGDYYEEADQELIEEQEDHCRELRSFSYSDDIDIKILSVYE